MPCRAEILRQLSERRDELHRLGARRLQLFGSFARDEARPESDVDLLVDLDHHGFDRYMDQVNEAKSIAAGIDPDSASTLSDPNITVGVLPKSVADAAGVTAVTDGDTILVTEDALNGDPTALAVILGHEADHAQNGPLGPCQHAGSFMDVAGSWANAINGPNGHAGMCAKFKDAVDKANKFAAACAKEGGTPTRADGSPAPDWPMPNPPCQD